MASSKDFWQTQDADETYDKDAIGDSMKDSKSLDHVERTNDKDSEDGKNIDFNSLQEDDFDRIMREALNGPTESAAASMDKGMSQALERLGFGHEEYQTDTDTGFDSDGLSENEGDIDYSGADSVESSSDYAYEEDAGENVDYQENDMESAVYDDFEEDDYDPIE